MIYKNIVLLLITLLMITGCGQKEQEQVIDPAAQAPDVSESANDAELKAGHDKIAEDADLDRDVHSFARPDKAWVRSLDLDVSVDFSRKTLSGIATLEIERKPGVGEIILDTRELTINEISLVTEANVTPLKFVHGDEDPNLGTPVSVRLPSGAGDQMRIAVDYETSPGASGLQWLEPPQTAGKVHPFLFTQSQAIHARSWLPLQDTPAVRMTYRATIRVAPQLRAVMSASNEASSDKAADGVYRFEMPQAIPSYLIALGVGDLVFVPMSGRTGVFAEPLLVKAAADEFADTEKMLRISEQLYGPYRWGRYDLLILPPSFPYGGMENPRLSFITPTVIAGDKSLVSLIAHELAHSWSGNLITNATWRDLWLNEGFTSFLTSRIMEAVYSKRRSDMEYFLDYQGLVKEMAELSEGDQILAIDLQGRDADDVFSGVPYTKGQIFLSWLESEFGREKFDQFLRNYFDAFSFQSITTSQFLKYLQENLIDANPGVVTMEEVNQWVFESGLPDVSMVPRSDAFQIIEDATNEWLDDLITLDDFKSESWSVNEWLYFLNNLPENMTTDQLKSLDDKFGLTRTRNNEIAHSWLRHVIRNDYRPGFDRLEEYLIGIGRRKLIVPLYEDLLETGDHRAFVEQVYARARPGYHPLAQGTVDKILSEEK